MFLGVGCASTEGPSVITVPDAQYDVAFRVAVNTALDAGFSTSRLDRRSGVIESEPVAAGSLLEPWKNDNASWEQAVDNTIDFQRRRARFEFLPVPPPGASDPDPVDLPGADLLDVVQTVPDLTRFSGDLELRVFVFVEKASRPGVRPQRWSLREERMMTIIPASGEGEPLPTRYWTPASRDVAFERRLLQEVQTRLAAASDVSADPE